MTDAERAEMERLTRQLDEGIAAVIGARPPRSDRQKG
jgi:hypothetical protein